MTASTPNPASRSWAIATPHAVASEQAATVFAEGGNAIDAAITAAAVLTVVYPNQCSIGGDLIALVGSPDGSIHAFNGSGRAPRDLSAERLSTEYSQMPTVGPHVVTVPGVIDGWHQLAARWGRRSVASALRVASSLARDGAEVAPGLARDLHREANAINRDPGLREIFRRDGDLLLAGDTMRQPRLADSLDLIAEDGPAAFYRGPIGAAIVRGLRDLGSSMTVEDFRDHHGSLERPLAAVFAGERYVSTTSNTQGGFFLEALSAAEYARRKYGAPIDPLGAEAPLLARILAITADDRDQHLGDAGSLDYDWLLSDERARELVRIAADPSAAPIGPRDNPSKAGGDTVAIVAADDEGNWISLIQSVFHAFGSTILDPATGVLLHNRGAAFSLQPGTAAELIGGNRPPHTLMPVLVQNPTTGRCIGTHGTMGGRAQPQIHVHLAHHLALGRTPVEALRAPRWIYGAMEAGVSATAVISTEPDVPVEVQDAFIGVGLLMHRLGRRDDGTGHAQLIRAMPSAVGAESASPHFMAASDPRADGTAISV